MHICIILVFSVWPQYVKDRIKTTYMYFGSSVAVTAASAVAAARSPAIMNLVMRNGFWVSKKYFYIICHEILNFSLGLSY